MHRETKMLIGLLAVAIAALSACAKDPAVCRFSGKTYQPGQTFASADNCNTCRCDENTGVVCEAKVCDPAKTAKPDHCFYRGLEWASGTSFVAGDGCNTCECQINNSTAEIRCTSKRCVPDGGLGDLGGDFVCANQICNAGQVCMFACDESANCIDASLLPPNCQQADGPHWFYCRCGER
ncbi:MAG: hypothetical protein H6707_00250 [Deltaproteobacteria bacterium]|nr:hypothetical protein [Deltaproteobacteria bacterium]